MFEFVENIFIMIMTIVVMIGVCYLALVLLNWGLKLRGGSREEDGLVQLWAQVKKEQQATKSDMPEDSADNSQS